MGTILVPLTFASQKARNSNARGEKVFFGHGGIRRSSNVQVSGRPPGQTFSLFVAAVSCVILVGYEGF